MFQDANLFMVVLFVVNLFFIVKGAFRVQRIVEKETEIRTIIDIDDYELSERIRGVVSSEIHFLVSGDAEYTTKLFDALTTEKVVMNLAKRIRDMQVSS